MRKAKHRNGVRYSLWVKEKTVALRQEGKTHREIVKELGISLGSADLWTKGIALSREQKIAIQRRRNKHIFTPKERKLISERLRPFQYQLQYRNEDLIDKIRKFYAENGRIPLKREFNSLRIFRERFGSWNNAIKLAGFEPNQVIFSKKFIAKDGHICDSFAEKIVDDWLSYYRIKHERNFPYENTKMTADFKTGNFLIEYFGLAGEIKVYDQLIKKKRILARDRKMSLIEIYPKNLFSKDYKTFLRKIFKPLS
ncbi:MAG: hypothetical protein Q8N22_02800 [bacterium]|nr:hypothetical protein [bacterium]